MRLKSFIITIIFILVVGLLYSVYSILRVEDKIIDVAAVNDIVQITKQNWTNLNKKVYEDSQDLSFYVINLKGEILYSNYETESVSYEATIYDGIKNEAIILDIIEKEEIVGKIIFKTKNNFKIATQKKLIKIIVLSYTAIFASLIIFALYFYKVFFKPFQSMEDFASKVASGNLEFPLEMDKENIFGAFTESFDIMREELKKARHKEYLAKKVKTELIASLSHDIKTPVASIKAICEIMELTLDKNKISLVYKKADQIEKLVNDMFTSTLEELHELKVNPDFVESKVIDEAFEELNYFNKIKIEPCPKCLIFVDELRIKQVIYNVISNSYKYANTEIHIAYSLNKSSLTILIKDFGQGVPEEEIFLIFNKFYRGKEIRSAEGSGLGLYISKYFMENMNGNIEAYNEKVGFVIKLELGI